MNSFKLISFVLFVTLAAPAAAQTTASTSAADKSNGEMQSFREKIKVGKRLLVGTNMNLTDEESKAFWPIYDAFQIELKQINDRMSDAIIAYAEAFRKGPITNEKAKEMIDDFLALEAAELKLKQSYVPKLQAVLPQMKVARYLQIENKIRALINYELADHIPLIQ